MGYKWLKDEKDEFIFELNDGRVVSVCHLDNKKLEKLARKVTDHLEKTSGIHHPPLILRECDWRLTCVLTTTLKGKPVHLVYQPTEIIYWLRSNIEAGKIEDTFREVIAIMHDGNVYLTREWILKPDHSYLLEWNRKAEFLIMAIIHNTDPSLEALFERLDNPLTRTWW